MVKNSKERTGIASLYANSLAIDRLLHSVNQRQEVPSLVFSDLDHTLTLNTRESHSDTNDARSIIERQGRVLCVITSRTIEWIISETERLKSSDFHRLPPHLKRTASGRREYIDPAEHEATGVLDAPIIIASSGTEIYIKLPEDQGGGYVEDIEYRSQMRQESEQWRSKTVAILRTLDPQGKLITLSTDDFAESYENGSSYIFPPDFRIKMRFETADDDLETKREINSRNKAEFLRRLNLVKSYIALISNADRIDDGATIEEKLRAIEQEFQRIGIDLEEVKSMDIQTLRNIRVTDDSDPAKGNYRLYLTPNRGYKARAANWVMQRLIEVLPTKVHELDTTFFGDSFPDLKMGLLGTAGNHRIKVSSKFILVGGSRLANLIVSAYNAKLEGGEIPLFAGENITSYIQRLVLYNPSTGRALFKVPLSEELVEVIIGEIAYPLTRGPETIKAVLDKK